METEQNEPGMVRPWLLVVLVVVILAGIGFLSWNYLQGKRTVAQSVSTNSPVSVQPTLVAPTPDTVIVTPVTTPTVSSSPISTVNDSILLKQVCQEANINTGFVCVITKIDGNYAYGQTNPGSAQRAYWFAKKINDTWSLVASNLQDPIPNCSDTVGFPKTIVTSCN